ncbi:MAG: LTA synthase family protein [Clostridia bacterium]|nr:LTA synthase family protein [Clostridia bacterium]
MEKFMEKFKTFIKNKKRNATDEKTPVVQVAKEIFVIALIVHVILEILNKRSLFGGIGYIIQNPAMFISGLFLLITFYSFGIYIAKRHFWYVLVSVMWIGLGVSNFILLFFRTTPLSAADFRLLDSVKEIASFYLSKFQIMLITVSIILLVVGLVIMYMKFPRKKAMLIKGFILTAVSYGIFMGSYGIALETGLVKEDYDNIANAFKEYGFAYSFAVSVVKIGMDEPEAYSLEALELLKEEMAYEDDFVIDEALPNIIFVQMESVFDLNRLNFMELNQNPMPNFSKLKKQYSSGYVTVPTFGAGTANTEFEVLSGMNLKYFGPGEYPYKTILEDTPVESIAYNLAQNNFSTHAIHNNTGTFYSRNTVYPMLGFDTFTSIEYMEDISYNPIGWSTDMVLVDEITKAIQSTENKDFVFAVSVQPHGKYPETQIIENPVIDYWKLPGNRTNFNNLMTKSTEHSDREKSSDTKNQLLYFANQLYEEDLFIGGLVDALNQLEEPTVLVLYGDHFPGIDITQEDLKDGTLFQTDYVIWDNIGLKKEHYDLKTYELYAYVLERLGYENGIMNQFHQKMKEHEDYDAQMELLQYDMLYGDHFIYNQNFPLVMTEMKMGVLPTNIVDIHLKGEALVIKGNYFTEWCEVYVNDEIVETIYLDEHTLIVPYFELEVDDSVDVKVCHVTESGKVLDETETFVFTK